ncbi:MAG: PadR family transcriptional regulator [Candidatus Aminicenantes bacterium]|nr:PadR family transcriptional regulator [Candidatus Aminicenantes bacterium]
MYELTKNEELILLFIWKLKDNAYGVTIRESFKQVSGKKLNYGSLYNTLYQLVRKGLVFSRDSESIPRQGGRHKILYYLTKEGEKALQRAQKIQQLAWGDVPEYAFEKKK